MHDLRDRSAGLCTPGGYRRPDRRPRRTLPGRDPSRHPRLGAPAGALPGAGARGLPPGGDALPGADPYSGWPDAGGGARSRVLIQPQAGGRPGAAVPAVRPYCARRVTLRTAAFMPVLAPATAETRVEALEAFHSS